MPNVSGAMKKLGIDQLDVEARLSLIEEIWESIDDAEAASISLSDAQEAELKRRLADADADPDDVISWEEVEKSLPPSRGGK